MNKALIFFTLVLISFSSCKKKQELPEQISEEPVFHINYFLNGTNTLIEAGNEDYFMTTSWSQDTSHVFVLRGDLAQSANTISKGAAMSILINDDHASPPNSTMDVDGILSTGVHLLNDLTVAGTKQTIMFKPVIAFKSTATYVWEVTDGNTDIRSVTAYSFSAEYPVGKTYSVTLKYDDKAGGCITSHTNVFEVGNQVQTQINAKRDTTVPEFRFNFSYVKPKPNGSYSCLWKFPDGSSSSMSTTSNTFQPGTYIISLMIVDQSSSDTCYSYYQLHVTDNIACESNFSASFSPIIDTYLLATATVLYTDTNGAVFSSRKAVQPSSSFFEIISVSEYEHDSNGNPTKSLNVKFNCIVQNGTRQLSITNASGIIAVAYKP